MLAGRHRLYSSTSFHFIYFPWSSFVIWCLKYEDIASESQRRVAPIQALNSFKHDQTLMNSRLLFI